MRALRVWASLIVLMAVAGAGSRVGAHPGSTTAVVITTRAAGALDIALHTDARALVAKLEVSSGAPLATEPSSTADVIDRIRALAPALVHAFDLRTGDDRAPVTLRSVHVDATGQAVVQLATMVPTHARTFTWATSLVYGAYPLSFRTSTGHDSLQWLQGAERSDAISLVASGRSAQITRGIWLGVTHIVPYGLDHILFVVGLVLLGTTIGPLAAQISVFTLAHSVTLGLSLYGVLSLPAWFVEPLIALSVAYVGIENLYRRRLTRWRLAVVFGFGLLHGLGFAEAVGALDLPRAELLTSLVSFNLGVELGQLAVVAITLIVVRGAFAAWSQPIGRFASAGIAAMGVVWTVERMLL